MQDFADKFLATVDDHKDEEVSSIVPILRRFLLIEVAIHSWLSAYGEWGSDLFWQILPFAAILTLTGASAFVPRFQQRGIVIAALATVGRLCVAFPDVYNHLMLECMIVTALAATDDHIKHQRVTLQFIKWLIVIIFFWTGLQKLLHACYFEGEFLAYSIATNSHFGTPIEWLFPAEVELLRSNTPPKFGSGPYRIDSPLFVSISNLSWIAEILLPILLVLRKSRLFAVVATTLFIIGVEWIAHELIFGILFINAILLFTSGRTYRRAQPILLISLLLTISVAIIFPELWIN